MNAFRKSHSFLKYQSKIELFGNIYPIQNCDYRSDTKSDACKTV